jgi:hypothetical protein
MIQSITNVLSAGQQSISTAALCPSTAHSTRTCILVRNNSASGTLYGKTQNGSSAPTISSTNCEYVIAPGRWLVIPAAAGVGVWLVASAGTISVNYSEWDASPASVAAIAASSGMATSASLTSEKAEDSAHTTGDTGVVVLAVRNDAGVALTDTDMDYSGIAVDSAGRVNTNTQPASLSTTSLNITSTGDTDISLNRCTTVAVQVVSTGNNNNISFLASRDGTNFVPVQARRTATGVVSDQFDLVDTGKYAYQLNLAGFATLRVHGTIGGTSITGIVAPIAYGVDFGGHAAKTFAGNIATASTSNISVLAAPTSGYRWVVESVQMSNTDSTAAGVTVQLKSGTNALGQPYQVPAYGGNNFVGEIYCNDGEAFQFAAGASRTSVMVNVTARKEKV